MRGTWNPETEEALSKFKDRLVSALIEASLCLDTGRKWREHSIAFVSRSLSHSERNYSVTERECLSVVFAI